MGNAIVLYVVNRVNIGRDPTEPGIVLATVIEYKDAYNPVDMQNQLREWCNMFRVPFESVALVDPSGTAVATE